MPMLFLAFRPRTVFHKIAKLPLLFTEPSAAPEGLKVDSSTSTTIKVSWKQVPKVDRNGEITGYKIYYKPVAGYFESTEEKYINVNEGDVFKDTLQSLEKYVTYEIKILAYTAVGDGPNSTNVTRRTDEDSK